MEGQQEGNRNPWTKTSPVGSSWEPTCRADIRQTAQQQVAAERVGEERNMTRGKKTKKQEIPDKGKEW